MSPTEAKVNTTQLQVTHHEGRVPFASSFSEHGMRNTNLDKLELLRKSDAFILRLL